MHDDLVNRRVLIMGLGLNRGGEAAAAYCASHKAIVTVTDLKSRAELAPSLSRLKKFKNIQYVLGGHRRKDFTDNDIVFQNPGVPNLSPYLAIAKKAGATITNEAAYFLQRAPCPIVGITGTRGKSTTAALVYHMLTAARRPGNIYLAGNIGTTGMLSILDRLSRRDNVILELSSFQLEHLTGIQKSPHIAVLTSLHRDHLNRYKSYGAYIRAKMNIFQYQGLSDYAVLPDNATILKQCIPNGKATRYLFSERRRVKGCFMRNGTIYFLPSKQHQPIQVAHCSDIQHHKLPYVENVLAALTVAIIHGIPPATIGKALFTYPGLPYRMQILKAVNGTTIINDSCATSPDATIRAVQASLKPIVLIAGGMDKNLFFHQLAQHIARDVQHLILLPGTASDKLKRALDRASYTSYQCVADLNQAVRGALRFKGSCATILFSPAATSFNLFNNEFDRGRQFTDLIKRNF